MQDIINNPDYLAYKFNFNTEHVEFLPVERNQIRRVSSLSREFLGTESRFKSVPLAELAPLINAPGKALIEKPPRFIFHTAFCASTFLSRCLDVDGVTINLREPQILLDAANAKRLQWRSKSTSLDYRHMPKLALLLLQKHAGPGEHLIIKPINSVNNIIPELLQVTGAGKSLMLYTDARNFLLSTLKKGESAKHTVRAMFDLIRCDFPHLANLRITDTIHMTDLKVILTLWRLQVTQAEQVLRRFSQKNVMASLYGEEIISNVRGVLQAANRFLQLGLSTSQIQDIANSDSRFVDAKKENERFSLEKRRNAYAKVEKFYGGDIDGGLSWMIQNNPGIKLIPELPGKLDV